MLSPVILVPAILNGLITGAIYALIALGLTLIYGVLHIINFAHGALLTAAMFAAWLFVTGQGELARGGARPSQLPALCLALAAMVNAKQSGIGLVAALAGAAAVAGWVERAVPRTALIRSRNSAAQWLSSPESASFKVY